MILEEKRAELSGSDKAVYFHDDVSELAREKQFLWA
jgi:hypothetical protein